MEIIKIPGIFKMEKILFVSSYLKDMVIYVIRYLRISLPFLDIIYVSVSEQAACQCNNGGDSNPDNHLMPDS
ncbi:hypothetical protein BMS3Abin06_01902 [bacterium BMS3Abin06]|nr:hypothetical protein BMS3Abin06_01902 [bacterium BMS3Abin06]